MNWKTTPIASISAALLLFTTGAAAQPAPHQAQCFYPNQMESWTVSPDSKSVYVRAGAQKIFRMDLAAPCPALHYPMSTLEFRAHVAALCTAVDLELSVRQPHGPAEGCLVQRLSALNAQDVAALSKAVRP